MLRSFLSSARARKPDRAGREVRSDGERSTLYSASRLRGSSRIRARSLLAPWSDPHDPPESESVGPGSKLPLRPSQRALCSSQTLREPSSLRYAHLKPSASLARSGMLISSPPRAQLAPGFLKKYHPFQSD